jgi:hypothetical protein
MDNTPVHLKRKREEFEKDAIELLTCPICYDYLSAPTIQCTKGHLICSACYKNIILTNNICPQCRCRYGPSNDTNHFLNQMLTYFECKCKYASYGCTAKLNLANRPSHERNCIHNREVACPAIILPLDLLLELGLNPCNWTGNIDDLVKHLEIKHGKQVEECSSNKVHLKYRDALQMYDTGLFFINDRILKMPSGYVYVVLDVALEILLFVRPLTINQRIQTVQIEFRHPLKPEGCFIMSKASRSMRDRGFQPCLFRLHECDIEQFCDREFEFILTINE